MSVQLQVTIQREPGCACVTLCVWYHQLQQIATFGQVRSNPIYIYMNICMHLYRVVIRL